MFIYLSSIIKEEGERSSFFTQKRSEYESSISYTSNLGNLLKIDKFLADDPNVTFNFLHASSQGFTLTTQHAKGSGKIFTYTD